MSIKRAIKRSVIIAGGFLATTAASAEASLNPKSIDQPNSPTSETRATTNNPKAQDLKPDLISHYPGDASWSDGKGSTTLQVNRAQQLINSRVTDKKIKGELKSIASKIGKIRGPEVVGAWGLGCGTGCPSKRGFTRMSVSKRAAAIKATKLTRADRNLLLSINQSMGRLADQPGSTVGAWGLGCGTDCNRPAKSFGRSVRQ